MNTKIIVLDSVTLNGTDASLDANQVLNLSGTLIDMNNIVNTPAAKAYLADTLQKSTGTPTAANSTLYTIQIQGFKESTGEKVTRVFSYTSDATATATEIADAFTAQINLSDLAVTATGGATLVIDAKAGFPVFQVTNIGPGVISFALTTPGVIGRGLGSQLIEEFPEIASQLGATKQYTRVEFVAGREWVSGEGSPNTVARFKTILLVNEAATNFADLMGTHGTLTYALKGISATYVAVTGAGVKEAAITVTTGVVTLSGSGSPTFATEDIRTDDIVYISTTATRVMSVLTQTTAVGTHVGAVSAAVYRVVKLGIR